MLIRLILKMAHLANSCCQSAAWQATLPLWAFEKGTYKHVLQTSGMIPTCLHVPPTLHVLQVSCVPAAVTKVRIGTLRTRPLVTTAGTHVRACQCSAGVSATFCRSSSVSC